MIILETNTTEKIKKLSIKNYINKLKKDKRNTQDLYLPLKKVSEKYDFNFKKK